MLFVAVDKLDERATRMAYELHIVREPVIGLTEWKEAVGRCPDLRLEPSATVVRNPWSGQAITVGGCDGDVAMTIKGTWRKVFRFGNGKASFNASAACLDDPNDQVLGAAFRLADYLRARLEGDEGEEIKPPPDK